MAAIERSGNAADVGDGPEHRLAVYGSLAPGRANASVLEPLDGDWLPGGFVRGRLHQEGWGAAHGDYRRIVVPVEGLPGGPLPCQIYVTADRLRHRPVVIDGPAGSLFVDDGGAAEPAVLFLHSLAGNASQWTELLVHLRAAGRRAVALDLRGHGRSDSPTDGDFTVDAYARDAVAAADGIGLERFVLVGHSMGAAVAARVAARAPGRISRLLLVDGAHAREEPTAEEEAWLAALGTPAYPELIGEFWRSILAGSEPEVAERVLADLRVTPQETVAASFRALVEHEPLEDLRRYDGPTGVVLGDLGDNPSAPHRHLQGLSHAKVERTGHWLHLDRPGTFNRLLDAFLAEGRFSARSGGR